jgi:hypothetical protein
MWQTAGGGHHDGEELESLKGIAGAFRPSILTALMGTRPVFHCWPAPCLAICR